MGSESLYYQKPRSIVVIDVLVFTREGSGDFTVGGKKSRRLRSYSGSKGRPGGLPSPTRPWRGRDRKITECVSPRRDSGCEDRESRTGVNRVGTTDERAHTKSLCRGIGVCNYRLLNLGSVTPPHVWRLE